MAADRIVAEASPFANFPVGGYEPPPKLLILRNKSGAPVSDHAAFQEIDDAVRQDDLKAWWKRWGTTVVAGAMVAIVAVAGLVGWRQYDASRRAQASTAYSIALSKIGQDNAAARAELDKLAESAPEPYQWLAALASAQLRPTPDEQISALLALTPQLPAELADLATVIAGYRGVSTPKEGEVAAKLDPLAQPERPFHASALELEALAAARKGDLPAARRMWNEILRDSGAPQGAHQRAQAMLALYGPGEGKAETKGDNKGESK